MNIQLSTLDQAHVPFNASLGEHNSPIERSLNEISINGRKRLSGHLDIQGDKTAAVHILFTLLFIPKTLFTLKRFPCCEDALKVVDWIKKNKLAQISLSGNILSFYSPSYPKINNLNEINAIRSSICMLIPLTLLNNLTKFNKIGGCNFTERPIDRHLAMAEHFGILITENCDASYAVKTSQATNISFDCSKSNVPSVGLTCHGIISALVFNENVTLTNISVDASIMAILSIIKQVRNIKLDKVKRTLEIALEPKTYKRRKISFEIPADQTVALTYLACSLVTGGTLVIKGKNLFPKPTRLLLKKMNVIMLESGNTTYFFSLGLKSPGYVFCSQAPGIPTDSAPILAALFANIKGKSIIEDLVYKGRDSHVTPLKQMGFNVLHQSNKTTIYGSLPNTQDLKFFVPDIRAGAALIIAALSRDSRTDLTNIYQICRGYEDIIKKLVSIGADITWK